MKTLARKVKRFLLDDEVGGEMPEYAVVVGIIIIVGAAVFIFIGTHINTIFSGLNNILRGAADNVP